MTWTWVEPFAGAAACALRLVGGSSLLLPPVAWMGGKRRLAPAILGAMGVPEGRPARVVLSDAGPWGWVWPLLLELEASRSVGAHLRAWSSEHPRALWERLAAQPPAEDLHERAAQWLWLQARSASGVPIWWDGWRAVAGDGSREATDRGEDLRWPGHQAQRDTWRMGEERKKSQKGDVWMASDGRGQPRPAGARAVGGRWEHGSSRGRPAQPIGQRGRPEQAWRMGKTEARTTDQAAWQKGESRGRTGGMVNPGTIADRIEAIAQAFRGVQVEVHHGDARLPEGACGPGWNGTLYGHWARLADLARTYVYLDPPYQGATGYGWDCPRESVLVLARAWERAGAVVAISEAVPLDLEGWHHLELTLRGGKPEWLTLSRPPARVPERQRGLFGGVA